MPGPYRHVHDAELRDIFYLTPQTGRAFMFTVHTQAFPGADSPGVTAVLREMLTIHDMSPAQRTEFKRHIAQALPAREQIAIRAHLISVVDRVFEEPWAYPALLDTKTCRKLHSEMNAIASKFDLPASTATDYVSSNAISAALTQIFKATGAVISYSVQNAQYFAGKGRDYYAFYAKRISDELALRGVPPSTLK